jgi:hypothetical protein
MTVVIAMTGYDTQHQYTGTTCTNWDHRSGDVYHPTSLLHLLTEHYTNKERVHALIGLGQIRTVCEVPLNYTHTAHLCARAQERSCMVHTTGFPCITATSFSELEHCAWASGARAMLLFNGTNWEIYVNQAVPDNPWCMLGMGVGGDFVGRVLERLREEPTP